MLELLSVRKIIIKRFPLLNYWFRLIRGKEYRFISLEKYIQQYSRNIRVLSKKMTTYYYSSSDKKPGLLISGDEILNYVIELRDVVCCAGSDTILLNNNSGRKVLYNEFKGIKRIRKITNCGEAFVLENDRRHWHKTGFPHECRYLECGIFLSGTFSFNYYHFLFAILPKLLSCDIIDSEIPLLVDKNVQTYPSFSQLIEICNVSKRKLLVLDENVSYSVSLFYMVSSSVFLPLNLHRGCVFSNISTQYDLDRIRELRSLLLPYKDNNIESFERIFISRRNASGRRSFNENECWSALENLGFVKVCPEEFTLQEQISLFNNARIIVGGSGAAFSNLLFCSEGCAAVVLNGYRLPMSLWSTILYMNGGEFFEVYDNQKGYFPSTKNPEDIHEGFYVNVDVMLDLVERLIR